MDTHGSWKDCPRGVVTEMADRLRGRRRRQTLAKISASFGLIAILVITCVVSTGWISGNRVEMISCEEAIGLFAQYHAGKLQPVDQQRVDNHLRDCPQCKERYRQLHPREAHNFSALTLALVLPPRSLP